MEALLALNLKDSAVKQSFGVGPWPWLDVGNVSDLTAEMGRDDYLGERVAMVPCLGYAALD